MANLGAIHNLRDMVKDVEREVDVRCEEGVWRGAEVYLRRLEMVGQRMPHHGKNKRKGKRVYGDCRQRVLYCSCR
jgi:hypothetical protein